MLALTQVTGPSVLRIRGQDVLPEQAGPSLILALRTYDTELTAGAMVVVDERKARACVLPL